MNNFDLISKPTKCKIIFLKNPTFKSALNNPTNTFSIIENHNLTLDQDRERDDRNHDKLNIYTISRPNLIHLSARLQDQKEIDQTFFSRDYVEKDEKQRRNIDNKAGRDDLQPIQNHFRRNAISLKKPILQNQRQVQDQTKNYQEKYYRTASPSKIKNTVINLLGDIDYSYNKKQKSKIQKRLKENFRSLSIRETENQKSIRKHTDGEVRQTRLKNKVELFSDFNYFLNKQQKNKDKCVGIVKKDEQIWQENRLKKLAITNPEEQCRKKQNKKLNKQAQLFGLYRFLPSQMNKNHSKISYITSPEQSMTKTTKLVQTISNSRRQKGIDEILQVYKGKRQDFNWSNVKSNKKHEYILSTLQKP